MKKVKNPLRRRGTLILAALLVSCMILTALASCQETKNDMPSNDSRTVSADTSEIGAGAAESEVASLAPQVNTEKQKEMTLGNIEVTLSNGDWDNQLKPLAKWFYTNVLGKNDSDITGIYTVFGEVASFNGISLKYVSYKLSNTEKTQYLSNLLGAKEGTQQYYLIDGQLSDTDKYYSLKDSWNKLKNHAVFGKYAQDFPEKPATEGVDELDIASLIGQKRKIQLNLFIDNNTVAVINSKTANNEKGLEESSDWKIDFIDLKTGSVISHKLKEKDGMELDTYDTTYFYALDNEFLTVYFLIEKEESNAGEILEYKVKLNTESNAEDEIKTYSTSELQYMRYKKKLTSESGRYYSFHKDYDLYLHDNTTGKDILVYDSYFTENIEEWNKVHVASAVYFAGDTLYFDIIGSTHIIGNGSYDSATKTLNVYKNGVSTRLASNGYIYGNHYDFVYRFNIKTPNDLELLTTETEVFPHFAFAPNEKYIVKITDSDNICTVKIYTSADYKEMKTYTILTPFLSYSTCVVTDDYVYLPMTSTVSENTAFIIKLGE